MKKILLEIDCQIKAAETRLAENEEVMSYETKREYQKAIADMKDIRKKMEDKLEKLDRLHKMMTKLPLKQRKQIWWQEENPKPGTLRGE